MVQGFRPSPQFLFNTLARKDRELLRGGVLASVMVGSEDAASADANPTPLIQIINMRRSCIQFWLDGSLSIANGQVSSSTRLEWQVYRGGNCTPDGDPVARGITILQGSLVRSGLLFQIDCAPAGTWWLCGRLMEPTTLNSQLRAPVRVMAQLATGFPQVVSGSAIG